MVAEVRTRKVGIMKGLTREAEIIRQVELAKKSQFKVTGIKVELEAVFGRSNWRTPTVECARCGSTGRLAHTVCHTDGCDDCDYNGYKTCESCYFSIERWNSDSWCQQWILRELHQYGLSVKKRATGLYEAKGALVYAQFYTDCSVDAEFTFTLSLKDSNNIFLLPKIIEVWKSIATHIGRGIGVRNAGMHMAFLQNSDCYYPDNTRTTAEDRTRFANFDKSLRLLMPALFFLGSADSKSRGMRFRIPRTSEEKYSAIHYYGRALEFRVFETCYDNPEQILDNFVVMRNCIRFWSLKYRSPNLERITKLVKFGNDESETLDRLYSTVQHFDLLAAGIRKLKPAYKTITELKRERQFTASKLTVKQKLQKARDDAAAAYAEYSNRYEWRAEVERYNRLAYVLSDRRDPVTPEQREQAFAEATIAANSYQQRELACKKTPDAYVQEELERYINRNGGQYTLAV